MNEWMNEKIEKNRSNSFDVHAKNENEMLPIDAIIVEHSVNVFARASRCRAYFAMAHCLCAKMALKP